VIPQKATYEIQDKIYVFVVDKNNVIRSRNITISNEMPDLYVVGNGLSENDKILLEGVQKVKENDKIQPELISAKEAIARLKLYTE
jgi:membrane fusion protein (multidrug efflux system)